MRLIPSLLALGGSGLAGALGGSAAGSGAASHFLAKDNQPRWMKLLKRSNMTGMGGAASGLLGFPTAAVYGAAASDKHPVRDGLAMGAGTLAGGVGGAGAAMLALGTLLRKDPRALAAVFGAGALGSVAGSAAGAGLTSHLLANDNTPRWRKALGL